MAKTAMRGLRWILLFERVTTYGKERCNVTGTFVNRRAEQAAVLRLSCAAGALAPVGLAGHAGAGVAGGDGNAACDGTHG